MKSVHKFFGLVLIAVFVAGVGGVSAETLQDAVAHVLKTNPEIRASTFNRLARDQEIQKARAGFYPTLDLTSGFGVTEERSPFKETFYPRSSVLGLRQNVFSFGVTTNEVLRQKARVKSQAYLIQAQSEQVSLQTVRAYLNVLRAEELHELAKENLVNHQRIYDQMKLRSESGVERKADLDQVMGRLALAQSNIVVTLANLEDARTDYQAIVGMAPGPLTRPDPLDAGFPEDMDDAVVFALDNYPLIKSARADLEAREFQYQTAKSDAYPKLDLTADYRWENDVDQEGYAEEFTAAAIVRLNIFRGGYDRARIAETLHQVREAREIYSSTQRQTEQAIRLSWEAYRAAIDKTAYLQNYVRAAALTMDAFAKQWMVGRRTMFDVLDTQAEYINAKADLVNAQYDKTYSEYRVLSAMGNLVHALGLQWPEESKVEITGERGLDVTVPRDLTYHMAE
ncbi:MAG: TolC family outer membrane protein [Deltaproteobacteria bacterium]|nr:TolC family outer membrane protein [Deltaproteobacteria bacterium]MBW2356045.1 TolC family outer membrane protein [Deltaproteobacteria bacterium]